MDEHSRKVFPTIALSYGFGEAVHLGFLECEEDTVIDSTVLFQGSSDKPILIGSKAEIGPGCVIRQGSFIGSEARLDPHTFIQENCVVGSGTFIGHGCTLRPETHIGNRCIIGHGTVFEGVSHVGDDSLIHAQNHITKGVLIGRGVFIAPMFVGANDPVMAHGRRHLFDNYFNPYVIEDGVRIAVGVTIVSGIKLGKNCVIGAHALVTKDVPPNEIWVGLPARKVGEVPEKERLSW